MWLGAYVAVGVLYVLWNTRSMFFRTILRNEERLGRRWTMPLACTAGVFLWPFGVPVLLLYWLRKRR